MLHGHPFASSLLLIVVQSSYVSLCFCAFFLFLFVFVAEWVPFCATILLIVDGTGTGLGVSVRQVFFVLARSEWGAGIRVDRRHRRRKKGGSTNGLFLWWHGLYVRRFYTVFFFFSFFVAMQFFSLSGGCCCFAARIAADVVGVYCWIYVGDRIAEK